jgi:hypothetical protein
VRTGALVAGRYRVEREIGSGGMGVVWRARDETLGRLVAIKQAHPASDGRRLRALTQEARMAGVVGHARVVTLYDLVEAEGVTWLIMEYVPSRDLSDVLDSDGVLSPREVARIGAQLADALEAVHALGIVHGDVKPDNILITPAGDAKLTDFGVARAVWADETLTDSGLVRGSPAYLAPEVARGTDPLPASDVFSLGAALFAAAEGVSPLGTGQSPLTMVWRAASEHIATPDVSGPLGVALSAMLSPASDDRPSAAEAKVMLERCADDLPEPAPVKEPVADPVRRRPLRRRGAVAAVALSAAVAALSVFPSGGERQSTHAPPVPRRPGSAIGDPHTADPCALLAPTALRRFGEARLSTTYGNFNQCDVLVQHDGDDLADVKAELENGAAPEPGPRDQVVRHGALRVVSQPADGDECDRLLIPPGGGVITIWAQRTGRTHVDLCAAATAATDHAVGVLARGPIPRRVNPPPAGSLADLDTCSLLTTADLSRVHGLAARHPEAGFGGWECRWDGPGDTSLRLRFDRNPPLTSDDGHPTRLGDHAAYVEPDGDGSGTCLVQVVHRTYSDTSGQRVAEIVYLVLSAAHRTPKLCRQASELAGAAAAKLPPV